MCISIWSFLCPLFHQISCSWLDKIHSNFYLFYLAHTHIIHIHSFYSVLSVWFEFSTIFVQVDFLFFFWFCVLLKTHTIHTLITTIITTKMILSQTNCCISYTQRITYTHTHTRITAKRIIVLYCQYCKKNKNLWIKVMIFFLPEPTTKTTHQILLFFCSFIWTWVSYVFFFLSYIRFFFQLFFSSVLLFVYFWLLICGFFVAFYISIVCFTCSKIDFHTLTNPNQTDRTIHLLICESDFFLHLQILYMYLLSKYT